MDLLGDSVLGDDDKLVAECLRAVSTSSWIY